MKQASAKPICHLSEGTFHVQHELVNPADPIRLVAFSLLARSESPELSSEMSPPTHRDKILAKKLFGLR